MKTNASSTALAWGEGGGKRCIFPCEVGTKIVFLFYGNEIHTCATVKDHIEDKIFKILYMISHKIYNNRGTALSTSKIYTYFKSNRSMISF